MKRFIFSFVFLLFCSPVFAANQVLLISWDGSEYQLVADLLQSGKLPNLSKLGTLHKLTDTLECRASTVTKPQHAIMLTGETACMTGITRNTDMTPIPAGLTIYEKLPANIIKAHIVSKTYLDENTFANSVPFIDVFFSGNFDRDVVNKQAYHLIKEWQDKDFFMFLHLRYPDHVGHDKGVNSEEYKNALIKNDRYMAVLLKEIKALNLDTKVIVLSDHGFGCPKPTSHGCSPNTFIVGTDLDMDMETVTPYVLSLF